MDKIEDVELNVFITHFIPRSVSVWQKVWDKITSRLNVAYLRSWARLMKHGTRGNQPWKLDVMTKPRRKMIPFRESFLAQVIKNLEFVGTKKLNVHIFSNESLNITPLRKSTRLFIHTFRKYGRLNSLNNSPWIDQGENDPWDLLWEHKAKLKEVFMQSRSLNSLYLVMDDDLSVTRENIEYWIVNRKRLKSLGLIPSFVLIEYSSGTKNWLCPSIHNKSSVDTQSWIPLKTKDATLVCIPSLYAGMFIMDVELMSEYIESPAFDSHQSKTLTWWDKGARSAMGLQFVNVPHGYPDRYAVQLWDSVGEVAIGSLIHHLPNLYASVPEVSTNFPTAEELLEMLSRRIKES